MEICKICNKQVPYWDFYTFKGEKMCSNCYNEHIYQCPCCNGTFDNRKVPKSNKKVGNKYLCPMCAKAMVSKCDHCKKIHFEFNIFKDKRYCLECVNNAIHSYHHSQSAYPFYAYRKTGNYKTRRGANGDLYFGIELETDRKTSDDNYKFPLLEVKSMLNNEAYFETDCSLGINGAELITYPHTEDAFYNLDWANVLDYLVKSGRQSHNSGVCGLHQHINRKYFGNTKAEQNENIAKVIVFYHLFWDDIVKFSRRTSFGYCRKIDLDNQGYYNDTEPDIKKRHEKYAKHRVDNNITSHGDAINLSNRETVEFRIMRGTLNYDTFMASIDFNLCVAKRAKELSWNEVYEYKNWFKNISKNTLEYMKKRKCFKDMYPQEEEPQVTEIQNEGGEE